jgi:DNA-binding CsgD family transcriptional regulator
VELLGRYSNQDMILRKMQALLTAAPLDEPVRSVACEMPPPKQARQLIPAEISQVVNGYTAGSSLSQLAERFGIHSDTIRNHLKRAGVPRRPNERKLTDETAAEVAALYLAGSSTYTLGQQFGVSADTIQRELLPSSGNYSGLE